MAASNYVVIEMNVIGKDTSPFDMLSNEVALIPIKMAMNSMNQFERHDFLFDVIAKVSTRFLVQNYLDIHNTPSLPTFLASRKA